MYEFSIDQVSINIGLHDRTRFALHSSPGIHVFFYVGTERNVFTRETGQIDQIDR